MSFIRFNWVDILFLTLLIRIGYVGFKNGFLREFLGLLGLLTAFVFSFNNYALVSQFLSVHTKWADFRLDVVSFLSIFFIILFLFKIGSAILTLVLGKKDPSALSKLIGFLLSFSKALLLISLVSFFCVNGPFEYLSKSVGERSFSSHYVSNIAPFTYKIGIKLYPWERFDTPLAGLLNR